MKHCKVCDKLADNGAKYCEKCGSEFEYDPRVTPFSETKIILGILIIALVSWIIYTNIPLPLPDPTECSQTSVNRFERIANNYYRETRNILRKEVLFTTELSALSATKNEAKAMAVPACLEPAKSDLVNFLDQIYFVGVYSLRFAYQGAAYRTERAGEYWESLNTHLDEVRECLPNCP